MYVIQITPLIRGTKLETLSYFSAVKYPLGSFIKAPIRKKEQLAVVTKVDPVSKSKTSVKSAAFSLRKLPVQKDPVVVPESLRSTAEALAKKYPTSAGAILYNLLPPDVRRGSREYPSVITHLQQEETIPQLLTARIDERFMRYQSHIRSMFAQQGSTLFIVPTTTDLLYAAKELSIGVEDRVIILSGTDTKRKRDAAYEKIQDTSQPKLIVTTPAYAYIERADLKTIVVEQSASSYYTNRTRPYLDHRDALIAYAKCTGRSIILGDTVPRTEDEVARRLDSYLTYGEESRRIVFPAPLKIIEQKDKPQPEKESPFTLFSPYLKKSTELALEGRGHVFFYAARRGLAPVVACVDCGYVFRCPDSNSPYSLLKTMKDGIEQRWFVSSASGRRVKAADVCDQCGSWRLRERGIGIQQIVDEWKELYPDQKVFVLDSETAPTATKALAIVTEFYKQKGAVLIGTQLALAYLYRGVDVSAVISLDAVRATPTWRADESVFRLLLKLRESTESEVILQTRNPAADSLLEYASRGAVERFYDDEIGLRQLLKYPPFSNFVLLTWSGDSDVVARAEEIVKKTLDSDLAEYYTSPHSQSSKITRHCLLRVSTSDPDLYTSLLTRIKALPPFVKIEINPDKIV